MYSLNSTIIQFFPIEGSITTTNLLYISVEEANTDADSCNNKHWMDIGPMKQPMWGRKSPTIFCCRDRTSRARAHTRLRLGTLARLLRNWWLQVLHFASDYHRNLTVLPVSTFTGHKLIVGVIIPHHSIVIRRLPICIQKRVPAI